MGKRSFLLPFASVLAALSGGSAAATTPPDNAPDTQSPLVSKASAVKSQGDHLGKVEYPVDDQLFHFTLHRTESGAVMAAHGSHSSHASHVSHASHRSHYSGG